ncbi:MAG: hypothetical protein RLZZ227_1860 [Pseudomonadota bacterium]
MRNPARSLVPVSLVTLMALLAAGCSTPAATTATASAAPARGASYPDWSGQWQRIGSLNWPPEGYEVAGPAPLTPEYQAIYEQNLALRAQGILAGDPPATCLPPGMPRMMKMSFPMEIIITPAITYIYADWESQIRRVYTDGRAWPEYILPEFNGYSIGTWRDDDNDGRFDTLAIETRGIKGPRSIDSSGVMLHSNDATVVFEEIFQRDANTLENKITTIDDAFTRPWTINQQYSHVTDNIIWVEYVCAEGNRHIQLGDEWYFLNDDEGILEPTRAGQPALVPASPVPASP